MRKTRWAFIAALFAALCSTAPITATASAAGSAGFPVTVKGADGSVTVASRPTRILSLSPSATQMLYAIGAGSQVVGVDKYSTWPANAPRTSFTGFESSAEDYLPLRPDLVVLAFSTGTLVAQLAKLRIPTLLLPPAASLAQVGAQLRELGRVTGHERHAALVSQALVGDLTKTAASVRARAAGKTYYLELDPTLYSATSKTFVGAVFALFAMRDIADAARRGGAYPQLSAEYLLKANPDYVFLADTNCCGQDFLRFSHRPGFGALRAVKDHEVVALPDSVASQWGPHTLEVLADLVRRAVARAPVSAGA